MIAVHTEHLSRTYRQSLWRGGGVTVVDDVSFNVPQGSIFGLLGPNGAGKTSVMKMMCGLLTPTSGDVEIYGHSVVKHRKEILQLTGTLLEGRRNLYWPLTVRENLEYFGKIKKMKSSIIRRRIEELFELMQLSKYSEYEVGKLSTGNQQKVSLAATIIHEPKLVMLDEPTLGLDVEAGMQLREIIKGLVQDNRSTVFLTTHDMGLAQHLCDEFLILMNGRIERQFDNSVFNSYSSALTYKLEIASEHNDVHQAILMLRANFEGMGLIDCSLDTPTNIKVVLTSASILGPLLMHLEGLDLNLVRIEQAHVQLEDIFLNVKHDAELLNCRGEIDDTARFGVG